MIARMYLRHDRVELALQESMSLVVVPQMVILSAPMANIRL